MALPPAPRTQLVLRVRGWGGEAPALRRACSGHAEQLGCCSCHSLSGIPLLFPQLFLCRENPAHLKSHKQVRRHSVLNKTKGPSSINERKKVNNSTTGILAAHRPCPHHHIIKILLAQMLNFVPWDRCQEVYTCICIYY